MPFIQRYWSAGDPDFCDGEGAETFSDLLNRAATALARLAALPADSLVFLFGHGQFIHAARTLVSDPQLSNREKMQKFWVNGNSAIANVERVELECIADIWRIRVAENFHGPTV